MAKWLVTIYIGVDTEDDLKDPTISYMSRQNFDSIKVGSMLNTSGGKRLVKKVKMSPFGKPWHKQLACEVVK